MFGLPSKIGSDATGSLGAQAAWPRGCECTHSLRNDGEDTISLTEPPLVRDAKLLTLISRSDGQARDAGTDHHLLGWQPSAVARLLHAALISSSALCPHELTRSLSD